MKARLNDNGGFGLIEAMFYIVLLAVAVTIFTAFTTDVIKGSAKAVDKKSVWQNSRFVADKIVQEVKTANQITGVSTTSLALLDAGNASVSFYFDAGQHAVFFQSGAQNSRLTAEDVKVTGLNFTAAGGGVRLDFTLEKVKPAGYPYKPYRLTTSRLIIPRKNLY